MKKDSVMTGASPPAEPIVRIRGLRKSFGNHVVLNGIDFDVLPSQVVVVIGPSGSGKSTFLRCCNGLEQPEGGTVEICGRTLVQDGRMLPDHDLNALREEVGEKNLAIQLDLYHAQRTQGELAATLAQHLAQIGHIQIADNPGRHEPGSGEINYAYLFQHLDRLGYSGWVGCEYRPASTTQAGLGWLHALTDGDARVTLLGLT